jgi:tetratricopeptide (TPR) repeat protein
MTDDHASLIARARNRKRAARHRESIALFARLRKLFAAPWSTRRRAVASSVVAVGLAAAAAYGGRALWLEYHFRAAERAQERRDFGAARDHLAPYLAAYPESGPGHFLAARAARRAGRLDEAADHLDVCRRLRYRPDDVNLERVLLKVRRGESIDDKYLRERVEQGHPDALLILEVLTDDYLRNYRLYDALWSLNQYLERRPDETAPLVGRAFVWEKLFSFADAERDYRRALEVDPDHEVARRRLAELLLTRRDVHDAAAEYEHLRQRDPDNPAYLLGLARCRRQDGRLDEARRLLAALLERDAHYPGALTEMGRVANDDGRPAEAIDWLRRAVADAPADRVAYSTLLNCLRLAGRDQEERACRATLDRLDADLKRIDELTRAALNRPYDADLRCELGVLFLRNGEEAEGLRWLGLALEQSPAHKDAHRALAEHFEAKGRPDLAAPHRRFAPEEP